MLVENESTVCINRIRPCPQNYTYLNDTRLCLRLQTDAQTKPKATTICQSEDGYLLNTDTQDRWDAALTLAGGKNVDTLYIDGQRDSVGGNWSYSNGVDPEKNGVPSKWKPTEPSNDSDELCRAIVKTSGEYFWFDRPCVNTYAFICEIRT